MKVHGRILILALLLCISPTGSCLGFSLLGPYKPWMVESLSYRLPDDIGGPMTLREEYRWNVPVITYGFDSSFLKYFGEDGVSEVENAIRILNDLPPASALVVTDYPTAVYRQNYVATSLGLVDLKSVTLGLLVEQLGLASPTRYVFTLRARNVVTNEAGVFTNYSVNLLNFDPLTVAPSDSVNEGKFSFEVLEWGPPLRADVVETLQYPGAGKTAPAADRLVNTGEFLIGLSRDDVGGLRFLLQSNNWNWEHVLPGVQSADSAGTNFVDWAIRPGVEKITFAQMERDASGQFQSYTNTFTDIFLTNGRPDTQTLRRVITRPDILFAASDFGIKYWETNLQGVTYSAVYADKLVSRTDTANWQNNGQPTGGGPGVIRPPITLSFGQLGRYTTAGLWDSPHCTTEAVNWAAFDGSTNPPVVFYGPETVTAVTLDTHWLPTDNAVLFESRLLGAYNATYRIEHTSNWVTWSTLTTLTNTNGTFCIRDVVGSSPRFYRAILADRPLD